MKRVTRVHRVGEWPGEAAKDSVTLSHENRRCRRVRLTTEGGREFLLDLPRAATLRDGDGLSLDGEEWIQIRAANERLAEITGIHRHHLLRIAWHLGNRHVPTVVEEDRLLIQNDRVIVDMVCRLGARVQIVERPFYPEGGAYDNAAANSDFLADQDQEVGQRHRSTTHHG